MFKSEIYLYLTELRIWCGVPNDGEMFWNSSLVFKKERGILNAYMSGFGEIAL